MPKGQMHEAFQSSTLNKTRHTPGGEAWASSPKLQGNREESQSVPPTTSDSTPRGSGGRHVWAGLERGDTATRAGPGGAGPLAACPFPRELEQDPCGLWPFGRVPPAAPPTTRTGTWRDPHGNLEGCRHCWCGRGRGPCCARVRIPDPGKGNGCGAGPPGVKGGALSADTLPLPAPPAKTETLGDHTWRSPFSKPQEVAHTPHSKHPYAWVTGVRFDPDSRAQGCRSTGPSDSRRPARLPGPREGSQKRRAVGLRVTVTSLHRPSRVAFAPPARRRPLASPDPCKEGPGRPQLQRAIADALDCPGPPSRLPVRTPPPTPTECPLHEAYRPPRGFPSDHEAQVRTPSTSRREPPRTTKGARAARARKGPAPTQVDRPDGRWRGTGPRQGRATRASPSSAAGAGPGFAPGSPIRVRARAPRHPRAGPVTEAAAGVPCPGDRSALRDLSSRRVSASPPTLPTRLVKQEQASEPSPPCSSVSVSVSGPGRPGSSPLGRCPSSAGAFREPDVCEEKGRRRRGGGGGGGATPEDARGLLVDACGREGTTHPGPSSTRVWATGTAGASTEVGPRDPEREPPPGPWTGRRVPDYWSTGADGAGPPGPGDGAPLPGASPQKRGVRACLLARPPPPLHPRPEWPSGRALDMRAAMLGRGTADTGWAAEFSGLAFFSSGRGRRLRPWGKGRLAFAVQYCHQAESPRRIREPSAELSLPRGGAPGVTWECGGGGRQTGTDGMERHGGPGSGVRGPGGLAGRAREAPSHGSARAPPWWPPRLGGTGAG
eukprot:XP_022272130.1 collagen alpha-2(I) chain-like [Canis lupus familiaris]